MKKLNATSYLVLAGWGLVFVLGLRIVLEAGPDQAPLTEVRLGPRTPEARPPAKSQPVASLPAASVADRGVTEKVAVTASSARQALVEQPAFQETLLKVTNATLELRFGELFSRLMLPAAEEEALRLALSHQIICPELSASGDFRNRANLDEAKEVYAQDQAKLKALLGPDNYRRYQEYTSELPSKNLANELSSTLAAAGIPLTPEASQTLAQVIAQRTAPSSSEQRLESITDIRDELSGAAKAPFTNEVMKGISGLLQPKQAGIVAAIFDQDNAQAKARELKESLGLGAE
jgi:hypothetical protein